MASKAGADPHPHFTIAVHYFWSFNNGFQDDDNIGVVLGVVFGVIALVIALVVGVSQYSVNQFAAKPAVAVAAADGTSVKVEGGVVKFYFASGNLIAAGGNRRWLTSCTRSIPARKWSSVASMTRPVMLP